jgi:hypothetical protein
VAGRYPRLRALISTHVHFEGIGSSTSNSAGLAWTYTTLPTHTSDYEFVGGVTRVPESVETSVNPYTGELTTSPMSFDIAASDLAAISLLHVQTRTRMSVSIATGSTTTTIRIVGTGSTTLDGTVVYIDDEAILLGTYAGSNTYTGCTRAFWGTVATAHSLGVPVYTSISFTQFRRVTMFTVDSSTGVETVRWRGFIDEIETDETGKIITVQCLELWAAVSGAQVNKGAPRLEVTGHVVGSDSVWQRPIFIGQANLTSRTVKTTFATTWFQLGDTLIPASYSSTDERVYFESPSAYWLGAPAFEFDATQAGNEMYGVPAQTYTDTAFEVVLIDQRLTPITSGLAYPYHPVSIAMALLISGTSSTATGYDVLGVEWGLAIPESLFDTAAITTLIATSADVEIDRLLLGWDGEAVDVMDTIINVLLRPYGFFPTITDAGLLSFARLEPVAIDVGSTSQTTALTPIPTRLSWHVAREGQFFQATAEVGALPWLEPDKIIVQRDGTFRDASRRSLFSRSNKETYDLQTLSPDSDAGAATQTLISRVVSGKTAAPMVGVTVIDSLRSGVAYDLGAVITLSAPDIQQTWWINSSGARVALSSSDASFIGIIIGRTLDLTRMRYDLTLLLLNWSGGQLIRWRAPSAEVVSASTVTLTVNQNAFHAATDDTSYFTVNDQVQIFSRSGVLVDAGPYIIGSVTATTIVLLSAPTVSATDIVRLAGITNFSNATRIPLISRPFAYFANGEVMLNNEDPDVYG